MGQWVCRYFMPNFFISIVQWWHFHSPFDQSPVSHCKLLRFSLNSSCRLIKSLHSSVISQSTCFPSRYQMAPHEHCKRWHSAVGFHGQPLEHGSTTGGHLRTQPIALTFFITAKIRAKQNKRIQFIVSIQTNYLPSIRNVAHLNGGNSHVFNENNLNVVEH